MKESVILFDKNMDNYPSAFISPFKFMEKPILPIILYTILWGIILHFAGYSSKVFKSILCGYLFGILLLLYLQYEEVSRYWFRTDISTNTMYYLKAPQNLNEYRVIVHNDNVFSPDELKDSIIIKADAYMDYVKNKKLKTISFTEFKKNNYMNDTTIADENEGGYTSNALLGFNIAQIILSIGLLIWNKDPTIYKIIYPWVVTVLIFGIFNSCIWFWSNTEVQDSVWIEIKNYNMIISYSVALTVICMTLQLLYR